jgi:carboxypeptidase C (cathepsin A)
MNTWRAAGMPITTSGEVFCGQRSTNISERLISNGNLHLSGNFNLNGRRLKPVEQAYSRKKKNTVIL